MAKHWLYWRAMALLTGAFQLISMTHFSKFTKTSAVTTVSCDAGTQGMVCWAAADIEGETKQLAFRRISVHP